MFEHNVICGLGFGLVGFMLFVLALLPSPSERKQGYKAVQGHVIRKKSNSHEFVVPLDVADLARLTGDYEYLGAAVGEGPTAGGFLVNDGAGGELWIPPGWISDEPIVYFDPRLNDRVN